MFSGVAKHATYESDIYSAVSVMHDANRLFRKEVIDAQMAPTLGTVRLATPVSHQIWTLAALAIAAGIVVWLCVGQYTRREHASGILVPQAGLLTVTAGSTGTVTKIDVAEGSVVHAGEALLTIADQRSSAAMGDTSAVISDRLNQQQVRLRDDLTNTRHLADEQAQDLRMQQRMLRDQTRQTEAQLTIEQRQVEDLSALLHRLQGLGTKGYVSALDVQQQRTQEEEAEGQVKSLARQRSESQQQLASVSDQLAQLPLTMAGKLNDTGRQIAQNDQSLAQNEANRATVLHAPETGVVSSILIKAGQAVTTGESLLVVMPQGSPLQAQLLVPSRAVGFMHVGTAVALHYQAFPYEKFGVQHGTVASISRNALTPSEITTLLGQQPPTEALYQVQVRLTSQTVEAYGKPQSLKPGMALDADLLLDRRPMIEWIFEPLYGMGNRYVGHG